MDNLYCLKLSFIGTTSVHESNLWFHVFHSTVLHTCRGYGQSWRSVSTWWTVRWTRPGCFSLTSRLRVLESRARTHSQRRVRLLSHSSNRSSGIKWNLRQRFSLFFFFLSFSSWFSDIILLWGSSHTTSFEFYGLILFFLGHYIEYKFHTLHPDTEINWHVVKNSVPHIE